MAYNRKKLSLPPPVSYFEQQVKQVLEIREGARSNSDHTFVTFGDLRAGNVLTQSGKKTDSVPGQMTGDGQPPNPPTNLSIESGFLVNLLAWDNPSDVDVWFIEVWVSTSQDRSYAERKGIVTVPGDSYAHSIPASESDENHYYWIRAIDYSGLYSTWEPPDEQGGYYVPSESDISAQIDQVLSQLQGQITDSQLHADLSSKIDGIDTNTAAVETLVANQEEITSKWTIQLNANDHIAGVGLMLDGTTGISNFEILADTFAIVNPGNENESPKIPFVVGTVDGVSTVGIDGNLVVDSSIMAKSIAAEAIRAVHLDANEAFVNTIQSANYLTGYRGWKINALENWAEFNDLTFTIGVPSDIRTQLNVEDGADVTGDNTADNTNHANGAWVDSGYNLRVYGDVAIRDGGDLDFYSGATRMMHMYIGSPDAFISSGPNLRVMSNGNISVEADDNVYIDAGDRVEMRSTYDIWVYQDFVARNWWCDLGSTTYPWDSIYCDNVYEGYAACVLENLPGSGKDETYDCLDLVQAIRPLRDAGGEIVRTGSNVPKLDQATLPRWCTNYHKLYQELRKENGDMLTEEDFAQLWDSGEFVQWRSRRDLAHTVDLAFGAIVQLNTYIQKLKERIAALES